jgi:hypothetical protein
MGHGMGRCQIQTTPNSFQTSSFLLLRVRSLKYTHKILQLLFIDFFFLVVCYFAALHLRRLSFQFAQQMAVYLI